LRNKARAIRAGSSTIGGGVVAFRAAIAFLVGRLTFRSQCDPNY